MKQIIVHTNKINLFKWRLDKFMEREEQGLPWVRRLFSRDTFCSLMYDVLPGDCDDNY